MNAMTVLNRATLNLIRIIIVLSVPVLQAKEGNPLKPIDTSSPSATIKSFYSTSETAFDSLYGRFLHYLASNQLFIDESDFSRIVEAREDFISVGRALNISGLPPAMLGESTKKLTIQLKEILDRLELPASELAPDAKEMERRSLTKWTIPDTEISLEKVTSGSRTGEYLFSTETVTRIPEFYQRIKEKPYLRGSTQGWYETRYQQPVMVAMLLRRLIPSRWIISDLDHKYPVILDEPVWRWIGFAAVLGVLTALFMLGFHIKRAWLPSRIKAKRWMALIFPIGCVVAILITIEAISDLLRFGNFLFTHVTPALWAALYLSMTWLCWQTGEVVAVLIIEAEKLNKASINSQMIRLLIRVATLVLAVLILVNGAERLGLPAYSVLASLGVGGVAVALAAQQTIANLLGSIIIMFEKPFKIGDSIRIMDMEGVVKSVGFRSTRIATPKGTLVTIPSSQIINGAVTTQNPHHRESSQNTLGLSIHNGPDKIQAFLLAVKQYLCSRPELDEGRNRVEIRSMSGSRIDVAVDFTLRPTQASEAALARQSIYIDILTLAVNQGIELV